MNQTYHHIVWIFLWHSLGLMGQPFEFVGKLHGHSQGLSYLTSRYGVLVSGDEGGEVCVWDVDAQSLQTKLSGHRLEISHLEFSPDGKFLSTASYDGLCKIWDTGNWQNRHNFQNTSIPPYANVQGNELTFACFDDQATHVYYGGYNMEVLRGNLQSGLVKSVFKTREAGITSGVILPGEDRLVIGYLGKLAFFNLDRFKCRPYVYPFLRIR